ncbi:MAG: GerMN domain-containing protein, partial [Actinomycetota bacterium]
MKPLALAVLVALLSGCQTTQAVATTEVYFVTDTSVGFRLASESREVGPVGDLAFMALDNLLSGELQPKDPDYFNLWSGSELNSLDIVGSEATIDFNLGKLNVGAEAEARAIDQLVWTLTEIYPSLTSVKFLVNGAPVESFAGHVDATASFSRGTDYEVLSPVQITSIQEGQAYDLPLTISGTACTFEANVAWKLTSNGQSIASGSVTASSGCPERGDWSVELPKDLAPGEYIFE